MTTKTEQREEISAVEAARRRGVMLNHLYSLIWLGRVKARKHNGRWLVDAASVDKRSGTMESNANKA